MIRQGGYYVLDQESLLKARLQLQGLHGQGVISWIQGSGQICRAASVVYCGGPACRALCKGNLFSFPKSSNGELSRKFFAEGLSRRDREWSWSVYMFIFPPAVLPSLPACIPLTDYYWYRHQAILLIIN